MQDWPLGWRIAVVLATLALSTLAWAAFRLWDRWERARDAEAAQVTAVRNLTPKAKAGTNDQTLDPHSLRRRQGRPPRARRYP